MNTQATKTDDHHCSVIEKEVVKAELADCDTSAANTEARENCHSQVHETSKKREQRCKWS